MPHACSRSFNIAWSYFGCNLPSRRSWPLTQNCHVYWAISWPLYFEQFKKFLAGHFAWLLPCDAVRCTVFVIVILSIRPTVRPSSVTLVNCVHVHMVRPTIMISSPYGSPIILFSEDITPKFEGGHPERVLWMRVGWVRIGDFRPISRRISETVRDMTKVTIYH